MVRQIFCLVHHNILNHVRISHFANKMSRSNNTGLDDTGLEDLSVMTLTPQAEDQEVEKGEIPPKTAIRTDTRIGEVYDAIRNGDDNGLRVRAIPYFILGGGMETKNKKCNLTLAVSPPCDMQISFAYI